MPLANIHRDVGISGTTGTQGRQGWHQLDRELCACRVRRWVDQNGTPATPWRFINLGTKPGGNEGARVALRAPPKSALDGLIKVDPVKRLLTRRFRSRRCIYSTVPRPSGGRHHCP